MQEIREGEKARMIYFGFEQFIAIHWRGADGRKEKEVKGYVLGVLHLTKLLDIQVGLSDQHLVCINESGAQGRGQSCPYNFESHHERDSA